MYVKLRKQLFVINAAAQELLFAFLTGINHNLRSNPDLILTQLSEKSNRKYVNENVNCKLYVRLFYNTIYTDETE